MIRIEHLTKEYPGSVPLRDLSVNINDGDVISVIGPSGTGKSTLLRCINRLETPTAGHIWLNGTDVTEPSCDLEAVRRKMGMVFQSFNLFGHLTVIENIMLAPTELLGKSREDAYREGMRLLRTVGLAEKALSYPDELSGGQKQRIAIARALAMDPDILLLDEPTSALDPGMTAEVQSVIRELAKSGKTMMIVTHEMDFARAISTRVFYMEGGGILEDGPPEQIFAHPRHESTRRFVRRLKVLELDIKSRDYDFPGTEGELDRFCARNRIAAKTAYRLHLAFEELVQGLLIPALRRPLIHLCAEYSEADESVALTVRYGGPVYNVTENGNELSRSILRRMASDIAYARLEDEEMPNQVTLQIR